MFVKKFVKNLGCPDRGYICNFQSKAFMLCTKFLIYNLKDLNILNKILLVDSVWYYNCIEYFLFSGLLWIETCEKVDSFE